MYVYFSRVTPRYPASLFTYNGRFRGRQLESMQPVSRAMCNLIGKSTNFDLPVDLQIMFFRRTVLLIMLYGCEVWSYNVVTKIKTLYIKYLKHILLGVHKSMFKDYVYR